MLFHKLIWVRGQFRVPYFMEASWHLCAEVLADNLILPHIQMLDNMFVFRDTAALHWFWYIPGMDFCGHTKEGISIVITA